jgi:hypothetical protein
MKIFYTVILTFIVVLIGIAAITSQPKKVHIPIPTATTTSTTSNSKSSIEEHKNGETKKFPDPVTGKTVISEWYNGHWIRKSGNPDWAIENAKKNANYQKWNSTTKR